ncbi:DUF4913 domain-containing protein [Actinotalea sp. BY-33]|uniref:DUF4913 domain-containing protein n=1 Tax=Actinotalea soli TaxID=2819234 RepID=A0A939LRI8_9CELL|nr:DUF4913 domain-containing protein [Actinotalea soli]MBO1751320.1 DUF4913 domain-containing protein [Actinotalea soli]
MFDCGVDYRPEARARGSAAQHKGARRIAPPSNVRACSTSHLATWVEQWLLPHYKRDLRTHRWDPRWWEYTEIIARLEALWQAWEYQRTDGMTGLAVFFRDYLDPAMREITSPEGPFWRLSDVQDRDLPEQWPHDPPPAGLFRAADHPAEQ